MNNFQFNFAAKRTAPSAETGRAFVLRVMPDMFAREWLNVGVCVVDKNGCRIVREIVAPGRLKCLYEPIGAKLILKMVRHAAEQIRGGGTISNPQLELIDVGAIYNVPVQDAIGSLFHDLVTVAAITKDEHAALQEQPTDTRTEDDWIKEIYAVLSLRHPFDIDKFIPAEKSFRVMTNRGHFDVPVHVASVKAMGRICVANESPRTVERKLSGALLEMERLAEQTGKKVALFIGRNDDSKLDEKIDYIYNRKAAAVHLEVETSPEHLAENLEEWLVAA